MRATRIALLLNLGLFPNFLVQADEIAPTRSPVSSAAGQLSAVNAKLEDKALTLRVKSRLVTTPAVHGFSVHVSTADGTVTLDGSVRSEDERQQVIQIARATEGVKAINDNLQVRRE